MQTILAESTYLSVFLSSFLEYFIFGVLCAIGIYIFIKIIGE